MSLTMRSVSYTVANRRLVSDLSLTLSAGEVVGLLGPNAAGKSTALKLLAGDLKPSSGAVELLGENIDLKRADELSLSRSVMAQSAQVVFDFTVHDIIQMGWVQSRIVNSVHKSKAVAEIVSTCQIQDLLHRPFNTLSGGEQQRVQFARNLLQLWRPEREQVSPRYLLLDEPTASMDIRHELTLLQLSRSAAEQNIGVLIVLHDLNLAARFMDRVVLMNHGEMVESGTPEHVFNTDLLTNVYQTEIHVEHNQVLDRLVVHS